MTKLFTQKIRSDRFFDIVYINFYISLHSGHGMCPVSTMQIARSIKSVFVFLCVSIVYCVFVTVYAVSTTTNNHLFPHEYDYQQNLVPSFDGCVDSAAMLPALVCIDNSHLNKTAANSGTPPAPSFIFITRLICVARCNGCMLCSNASWCLICFAEAAEWIQLVFSTGYHWFNDWLPYAMTRAYLCVT